MKQVKKSIYNWLQELPSGYREAALKNASSDAVNLSRIKKTEVSFMSEAIGNAFDWVNSSEGIGLWGNLREFYEWKEGYGTMEVQLPKM